MSEFPVANLEKRLLWGMACGVCAVLLNIGPPLLLLGLRIAPTFPSQPGPIGGLGVAILLILGILVSGLVGCVAGLVRPGRPAVMTTLICLALEDICMMAVVPALYAICAAIKVALIIAVINGNATFPPWMLPRKRPPQ